MSVMSSVDTIRNRLTSLRAITEQMRDCSFNTPTNVTQIRELIGNTRHVPPNHPMQTPLNRIKEQNEDADSLQQEEIVSLRKENLKLEERMVKMEQELMELHKQKTHWEDKKPQVAATPFFRLNAQLQICVCRLTLSMHDSDNLDYSLYEADLQLNKLVLVRRDKGTEQEFYLATLCDAVYGQGRMMVLKFREFEEDEKPTSVCIKFASKEERHKWDLAMFSNYHIDRSVNQPNLFQAHFQRMRLEDDVVTEEKTLENFSRDIPVDEKVLKAVFMKRRKRYLDAKDLIASKLGPKNEVDPESVAPPEPQPEKEDRRSLYESVFSWKIEPQAVEAPKEEAQPKRPSQSQPNPPPAPSANNLSYPQPNPYRPPPELTQSNLPRQVGSSNYPSSIYQSVAPRSNTIASKVQSQEKNELSQSRHQARVALQKGLLATKYSKDGFFTHDKKIFLSLDGKKLCWADVGKQTDYKSIPVEVIKKVEYGKVGQGILKHVNSPDAKNYCVITHLTSEYKEKTIELGSNKADDIQAFADNLSSMIPKTQ